MYCRNCGKEIIDNSKFCNYCGYTIVKEEKVKEKKKSEYYYMPKSMVWFWLWLVLAICSFGILFIVPICVYFSIKHAKYYYNDDRLIIERGVLNIRQIIIPLYRITNIRAVQNANYGYIYIQDKNQTIVLKHVKNARAEMMKLSEKWDNAKENNIRNEIF